MALHGCEFETGGKPDVALGSQATKDCMMFMGYKVQDMTRDGLLEVIKWLQWEKGDEVGCLDDATNIDYDKIKEIV